MVSRDRTQDFLSQVKRKRKNEDIPKIPNPDFIKLHGDMKKVLSEIEIKGFF
jgi:hypothetical protein